MFFDLFKALVWVIKYLELEDQILEALKYDSYRCPCCGYVEEVRLEEVVSDV